MLNQKKLAVAVTVALGASVGFMSSAQAASSLFFPHVVGSQTVASIITVINTANNRTVPNYTNGYLHQTLWTKNIDPATSSTAPDLRECGDTDQWVPTSLNDIASFDVYGEFGQQTNGILFENRVTNPHVDYSKGPNWSLGFNETLPQRGFLLVSNDEDSSTIIDEGVLRGEAFIFEFAAGATWGYQAASRSNFTGAYDYSTSVSADNAAIGILPYDEFETGLMVTPVDIVDPVDQNQGALETPVDIVDPVDQNQGALETSISLSQRPYGTRGFFDRDENPFSISRSERVVCVGRVDVEDLLFSANGATGQFLDGGWTTVQINSTASTAGTSGDDSNAIVFKLEYNMSDTFNGQSVTGVFNNATHILPAGGRWVQ